MRTTLLALCLPLILAVRSAAAPPDSAGVEFFEKKIRPVLVQRCYKCHATTAKKRRGGLALDTRAGLLEGGDSGPALVPGKPEQSLLLRAIRHTHPSLKMPPNGKLPDAVVADFHAWIARGAPDPRLKTAVPAAASWQEVLRVRRQWWSLQPVKKPVPPLVKNAAWPNNDADRFLLARLEQAGLKPPARADARTLIRRLSLVLTGLPPTAAEVEVFVAECSAKPQAAVERLIDRLLASPHFGERWARHWMDVVRYGETHGFEWNYDVHHAWRYRDYLVRAFNEDVPYDQFVREHLAGDLLPEPRWNRRDGFNESVIGTAFFRFGEVGHDDCIKFRAIGLDAADNQIDTLSKAFQATTIACARCHDHKLDAVSLKDYYALLGVLRSSRQVAHTIDGPKVNAEPMRQLRELKRQIRAELSVIWLNEVRSASKYLHAAQAAHDRQTNATRSAQGLDPKRLEKWIAALKAAKGSVDDPLYPAARHAQDFAVEWQKNAERWQKETKERAEFNATHFSSFGDFRSGRLDGWHADGHGLRGGAAVSGDFTIACTGGEAVATVLPAGIFTHTLSEGLNGALRSPLLPATKKYLSLQVAGARGGAVRLVTNNCQLNYRNFKYLKSDRLTWVTFPIEGDGSGLRQYAELMTKFNNPKFPDQLGGLGGGPTQRIPWEQAEADPCSFFGIARAVLHDTTDPPRDELTHLRPLFSGPAPKDSAALAARYGVLLHKAVVAWAEGRTTDADVFWLDWLLRRGLVSNSANLTPRLADLVARYRTIEKTLALPRVVPGLADDNEAFDQPVYTRGDYHKPGVRVPRRYLEVLAGTRPAFATRGSGRLELAERIASADNPLTARVMVNRIWHHLFGAGLVRTVDDFGHMGERPSHPALLDYLAARFVEEGWSVKRLVRLLVQTRAFQASHRETVEGRQLDPENRLLHRYSARRLEAEAIRDAILSASGRLEQTLYGPSVAPFREKATPDRRLFPGPLDSHGRRSLYIKPTLMEGPAFLMVFNFPGGKVAQGRRDVTNVPAQALALLNDPFVLHQAEVWAERLVARRDASVGARIEHMFRKALGRPPRTDECERFEHAVGRIAELRGVPLDGVLSSRVVWKDVAHGVFNLKEFIYVP